MNISTKIPQWAQAPMQKFIDGEQVPGTQTRPMDANDKEALSEFADTFAAFLDNDEVPGFDLAMGQVGVVADETMIAHYQGDPKTPGTNVRAVISEKLEDAEMVYYIAKSPRGFTSSMMRNVEGKPITFHGGVYERGSGYIISGKPS